MIAANPPLIGFTSKATLLSLITNVPVFAIIGRSYYPSHTDRHQYAIRLCQIPIHASGMDMFPGFSIVSSFKKASVGADENCTSGSLKNAAYPWLLKIFEYRRPYTRSVCCFQIYTPVIVGKYPGLIGGNAAMFVRENLFGPKRSCGIWCTVIESVSTLKNSPLSFAKKLFPQILSFRQIFWQPFADVLPGLSAICRFKNDVCNSRLIFI